MARTTRNQPIGLGHSKCFRQFRTKQTRTAELYAGLELQESGIVLWPRMQRRANPKSHRNEWDDIYKACLNEIPRAKEFWAKQSLT